ncbi:hypothetical protein C5F47_03395 [Nitrosopumilus cobalaminigenes]|uniref:Uncharacterized protein n=1 Tax=Nitrosopumilus cobalaminigenes TaxID=1470066 RepID=A0A7D5M0A7_9ARCH|nr:hypothetical protein [Nitrosopumilus cobalaminigenes]QLH02671.1 hypothetical protein C5F47_03395 [Nitrosopumilus cobalaminigenes]
MSETSIKKPSGKINYLFLISLFVGIIIYGYYNSIEPDIDAEIDLFEWLLLAVHVVATTMAFIIAKQFWHTGQKVLQNAYLALAIGMLGNLLGWAGWFSLETMGVENPYPAPNDLGFLVWHAGALIHLRLTTHRFQPKLTIKQLFVLFVIPTFFLVFYIMSYSGEAIFVDEEHGFQFKPDKIYIEFYDECNELCFYTSITFVFLNPLMLSYALVGFSVFRKGILGPAWMLLIIGIGLTIFADIPYYFMELYGGFDRTHWYTMFYFVSPLIITYALYKHRDLIHSE